VAARGESQLVDSTLVTDTAALVWMVGMNSIDVNAWHSRVASPAARTTPSSTSPIRTDPVAPAPATTVRAHRAAARS